VADHTLTKDTFTIGYDESSFQAVSVRPDGHSHVRHVQIDGGDELQAGQCFLGWSEFDATAVAIKRFPPEVHPRYPQTVARTWDFVQALGEPGMNVALDDSLEYGSVEYAVGYEHNGGVLYLPDSSRPEGVAHEAWRYCRRWQEFETSSQIIPKNRLKFYADSKPVPEPGTRQVFESTWYVRWEQVPLVLSSGGIWQLPGNLASNIRMCVMHTNRLAWDGFPPWTLLCVAPKLEIVPMPDGGMAANILYPMLVRGGFDLSGSGFDNVSTITPDWRRLIRPSDLHYWRVYVDNPANAADKSSDLYDGIDYQWLFRVDAPGFSIIF
jgi:hypothetical protein